MSTPSTTRPEATHNLRLDFFGGPILWRSNVPVRISPLQAALLTLALGTGRSRIPRAKIQSLLWNSDSDKAVRHRLSQLVYQTNQRCRTRVVRLEGEHLRVDTQAVATDLEELQEMIRTSNFAAACDIFERGFLSAFPTRKTEAFADWIETREHEMRARLRNKALADWDACEVVHDWALARESAEALSRLDPHDESVLRRVVRSRAMGGRVGEAETVYRFLAERVDSSDEWTPQRATTRLLETLEYVQDSPTTESRAVDARNLDIPLTGRTHELFHLDRSIGSGGADGAWKTVTVSGEAGLGKTRLIDEVLPGARARGFNVISARCGELERDIPLGPVLSALDAPWVGQLLPTISDPWRSHLLFLLPQFDSGAKPPHPVRNNWAVCHRQNTCEALLRLFQTGARSQPAVVVLDDFQWADEATVTSLQFLRRRWGKGDITLLLSYRTEDLGQNPGAARLVGALESESDATAIRLGGLEDESSRAVVASVGLRELGESSLRDIVSLAEGNPRFLIRIAAGVMTSAEPTPEIRVPASVSRCIARRIGELAPSARTTMSALAVLNRPVTVRCLMDVTGQSRRRCLDALDLLDERRLVEWTDERVSICREIVRKAVYEGLSPARRSLLHVRAAEALIALSRDPRPGRIAMHYRRAGDRRLAHSYALEAAGSSATLAPGDRLKYLTIAYESSEESQRRRLIIPMTRALHRSRQHSAAIRYGEAALADPSTLSAAESSTARLLVAEARSLLGRHDASATALDRFDEVEAAARKDGDELLLAEALDARLRLLHRAGDSDGVERLFDRMRHLDGFRDPAANSRLLATLAMQVEYDDLAEGLVCARRAVTIAREHKLEDEEMLVRQRHIAALAANGLIATREGRTAVADAEAAARSSDDLASHLLILLELAKWHNATGDLDMAARVLDEALVLGERTDCPEIRCLANVARGNLALAQGSVAGAIAAIRSISSADLGGPEKSSPARVVAGKDEKRTVVHPHLSGALAGLEGRILLERGRFSQAAAISERHPLAEPLTNSTADLILFHARLLSRSGNARGALKLLARGAEAHRTERPLRWIRLVQDLVRLARRMQKPRRALAARARDRALRLNLRGMADNFIPFLP